MKSEVDTRMLMFRYELSIYLSQGELKNITVGQINTGSASIFFVFHLKVALNVHSKRVSLASRFSLCASSFIFNPAVLFDEASRKDA